MDNLILETLNRAESTSKRSHSPQCETPNCQVDLDFQFSGQFNFKKTTQFIM